MNNMLASNNENIPNQTLPAGIFLQACLILWLQNLLTYTVVAGWKHKLIREIFWILGFLGSCISLIVALTVLPSLSHKQSGEFWLSPVVDSVDEDGVKTFNATLEGTLGEKCVWFHKRNDLEKPCCYYDHKGGLEHMDLCSISFVSAADEESCRGGKNWQNADYPKVTTNRSYCTISFKHPVYQDEGLYVGFMPPNSRQPQAIFDYRALTKKAPTWLVIYGTLGFTLAFCILGLVFTLVSGYKTFISRDQRKY